MTPAVIIGLGALAVIALASRRATIRPRAPVPAIPPGPDDIPPLPSREPLIVRAGDQYRMTVVAARTMDPQDVIEALERDGFTDIDMAIAATGPRFRTWRGIARWAGEAPALRVFFEGLTITEIANVGP